MTAFQISEAFVDPARNLIRVGRSATRVTNREMDVLRCLVEAKGQVVSRDELLEQVWRDVIVREDAPTLTISRLRRALKDDPRSPRYIETIPKRGYRLVARVEPAASDRRWRPTARGVSITLTVLLILMTALFMRVRSEYAAVGAQLQSQTEPAQ